MLTPEYNILIVEDEPMTCEAYERCVREAMAHKANLKFRFGPDFETAKKLFEQNGTPSNMPSVLLLDLRIPGPYEPKYKNGEKIGLLARKKCPSTKILVISSISHNYRIHRILDRVWPEGFLLKSNLDNTLLKKAILHLTSGKSFYCEDIMTVMHKERFFLSKFGFDTLDREIIYLLHKGYTTANISHTVNLSLSAVEKRKRKIANRFDLKGTSTSGIVHFAKELQLI